VEAISTVISGLPGDLPAAVLVVLHVPAWGTSVLPEILDRSGPLPAHHAVDGERLFAGRVYVAPPDHHLVTEDGVVRLTHSPKENGVRPAIDTLFRSAAHTHRSNVVAVVLSGTLDDGTAGLVSVKAHGGITVVQDPADAVYSSMPESAVRFAHPAHVVPIREVAPLVVKLVTAGPAGNPFAKRQERPMDAEIDEDEAEADPNDPEVNPSSLTCPECGGTLWERDDGDLLHFRCRVGHAYSPESLFSHQQESLEGSLWAAVVALQERCDLAERLARRMNQRGRWQLAARYERQAEDARRRAAQVREAILQLTRAADTGERPTHGAGQSAAVDQE
jgi:two-component system chemotaxis response regulator CheB